MAAMNKEDHPYLSDSLMDHPAVVWMTQNIRLILQSVIFLVIILFVVYRVSSAGSSQAQTDYIKAANNYSTIANTKSPASALDQQQALADLRVVLSHHPELAPKYDGWLAQALLNEDKVDEAAPFATATLKRTAANNLPLYNAYAITTLTISKGNYKEALTSSEALKQQLLTTPDSDAPLLAFTQLRIAILHQLQNDNDDELASWTAFKNSGAASQSILNSFTIGNISLANYVDARMKSLQNNSTPDKKTQ